MKNLLTRVQKVLKSKRGDIFQFIIILAIVAIMAVVTLPGLNDKISGTASNAITRIENMDTSLDADGE